MIDIKCPQQFLVKEPIVIWLAHFLIRQFGKEENIIYLYFVIRVSDILYAGAGFDHVREGLGEA